MSQNAWYPPGSAQANAITANQGAPNAGGALAWPVTAAALPLPSGAATALKQDTGNTSLASIDSKLTSPLSVTGPLTDAELRAVAVPVSGPLTDTQLRASAVPISASALPLPSGAATEATLGSLDSKVTACNTGAVVVSSSALPSGASTSANQTSILARLTGSLVPAAYDYISLSYTGSNITTVVYKSGGSGGSTVKTLTLAYTGSQLDSVTAS